MANSGFIKSVNQDAPSMPFLTAAGLGRIPGHTRVVALGHNPNIAVAGTAADVWEGGGDYPFQTAATKLEVLSASASDTAAAGTGARTVLVSGLDANFNQISEVVALNGTTPVPTVNSYLRVNTFTTTASGSGGTNAGDITLRVVSGGATQGIARAGYGFGRTGIFTVPGGFTMFITSCVFTILAANGASVNVATFALEQRNVAAVATPNLRIPLDFQVSSTTPYRHDANLGIVINQKTDFVLRVTTTGQTNSNVTAAMEALLVDNAYLT